MTTHKNEYVKQIEFLLKGLELYHREAVEYSHETVVNVMQEYAGDKDNLFTKDEVEIAMSIAYKRGIQTLGIDGKQKRKIFDFIKKQR